MQKNFISRNAVQRDIKKLMPKSVQVQRVLPKSGSRLGQAPKSVQKVYSKKICAVPRITVSKEPQKADKSVFTYIWEKIILMLMLILMLVMIPLISVKSSSNYDYSEIFNGGSKRFPEDKVMSVGSSKIASNTDYFCFKDESKDKILKLSDRDFMVGTLASEMPALFEKEALKAQAVAIYTYFCRLRNEFRKKNSDPEAPMFVANTNDWIYFVTDENMREKWKDKFQEYKAKMENAVDEVFGEVLKYNGELILAAYHAISSGMIERAGEIFGGDELPYLVNTPCESDKNVASYASTAEFSSEEFENKIKEKYPKFVASADKNSWVHDISHTSGGSVKKIHICNIETTGREIRSIFGLRSSNFDLKYDGKRFIFSVRGYGHGVGMSQYGAHDMALHGFDYKQILQKFYPGTTLTVL